MKFNLKFLVNGPLPKGEGVEWNAISMKEVKKIFARQLRKEQTEAEKVVWEMIRKRKLGGFKFRRQHVIEGFILDFYCPEIKNRNRS